MREKPIFVVRKPNAISVYKLHRVEVYMSHALPGYVVRIRKLRKHKAPGMTVIDSTAAWESSLYAPFNTRREAIESSHAWIDKCIESQKNHNLKNQPKHEQH